MSAAEATAQFEALLNYLRQARGFDFTGYKRPSLMRRVTKRMQMLSIERFSDYQDYLEVHPEEFAHLFNTILINVTSFFRDASAWQYLADEIIPRILAEKKEYEPIRVWSAACASGEEAYSLAILFAEVLGIEVARERLKVYATDVDEEALRIARQGSYTARDVAAVPPALLEKYFERAGERFVFHRDLRRAVIFGRHDLLQDAPIPRVDLLVCRNSLMYFNAETQARIFARFHFALANNGYLFLGKAEMLLTQSGMFRPVDLKRRIFMKVPKHNARDGLLMLAQVGTGEMMQPIVNHVRLRDAVLDANPTALIAVDLQGTLALANTRARALFNLAAHDIGRPLQELDLAHRPVEMRGPIDQVLQERRAVHLKEIETTSSDGPPLFLDIDFLPLPDPGAVVGSNLIGVAIICTDVTCARQLKEDLQHANQELETASEELQSTNEELETTNEELQSTVEELETTNEELQSTNEELQTINDELRQRSSELNLANAFQEAILNSLQSAVVVIDRNLHVRVWSPKAEDLWGLRPEEAHGNHLLNLDIGLPVDRLRQPIRACLSGEQKKQESVLEATNRRGKPIRCRVLCRPLVGPDRDVQGVILLIEAV